MPSCAMVATTSPAMLKKWPMPSPRDAAATGDAEAGESRPRVSYVDSIRLNPGAAE